MADASPTAVASSLDTFNMVSHKQRLQCVLEIALARSVAFAIAPPTAETAAQITALQQAISSIEIAINLANQAIAAATTPTAATTTAATPPAAIVPAAIAATAATAASKVA